MKFLALDSKFKTALSLILTILIFILLITAYLLFNQISFFKTLSKSKEELVLAVKAGEDKLAKRRVYVDEKNRANNAFLKLSALNEFASKDMAYKFLIDLSESLPEDMYISDFDLSKEVNIHGYSANVKNILDLLVNISHLPYIYNGRVVKLKKENPNSPFVEFFLNFSIKPLRETNGKN